MYCVAFIYEPGEYDAEFHRLNELIDAAAKSMKGFLGAESWVSEDGKRHNATYYWSNMDVLKEFSSHPKHLEAKREYSR
jgi:heme-degrading monooxygenase HmoA